MNGYLLDTDISSYFLKGKCHPLQEKVRNALRRQDVAISVISRAELLLGLEFAPAQSTLHELVNRFLHQVPVLSWNGPAAEHYARLSAKQQKSGQLIGIMDNLIAAHALSECRVLVTNNTRHFERVEGLQLENWL